MVYTRNGNPFKNILWLQWIAGIGAMTMLFTLGLMIGWTSPYVAKLTAKHSPLPITTAEASWVGSLLNFGRFLGAIVGGLSVHFIDSKRTLVIIGFPLMVAWICIIVADSVIWLYAARVTAGIGMGMSFSSFPIYLGEVASPSIRGTLVSLAMMGLTTGNLVGNIMGAYITMVQYSYVSLVPNVIFILLFLWIPQSPYYLIRKGRMEDAKDSIARYNPNVDSKIELESLKNFMTTSESLTFRDRLRQFNIPQNQKAALITLVLYFIMQFSGLNTVVFYQESILTAAKVNVIPPAKLVMISGGIGVVSGCLVVYVADKFERKVLMIVSSAGVGVSMSAFAVHFALLDNDFDPSALQWMPITAIAVFVTFVYSGITTVPSMILSELFAPEIKNMAACCASISLGLLAFAASKSYQPLVDTFGETYVFGGEVVLMVISIIFSAVYLPKTRGKSLQEIQDALLQK